jgi:hypothetical protein
MSNDGKFLNLTTGNPTLETAIVASAGAADANKIARLDATGKFDSTMIPASGGNVETRSMTASEALSAGDLINVHGTNQMRKADADVVGREANGYVLSAVSNGASGTVNLEEGIITGLSGMTPGATQFLATTPGARTETCPTGTNVYAQIVGKAITATEMLFRPGPAYLQA